MNLRNLRLVYPVYLFISVPALLWYDQQALRGLANIVADESGQAIMVSDTVIYPFTYGAALSSIVAITGLIWLQEKKWWAIPLGFLASHAATVGMINIYEQFFMFFGTLKWGPEPWLKYYGSSFNDFLWMLVGLTWVAAILPWVHRQNLPKSIYMLVAFLAVMVLWYVIGYPDVSSGGLAYVLNATSRVISNLIFIPLLLPVRVRPGQVHEGN